MLLTPDEIRTQTRALRKECFPGETDDFLDIYFEDKYRDDRNLTRHENARVVAAAQLLPYSMNFYGSIVHVGCVSGLCTHPDFRRRGHASSIVREAHRRLYRQGGILSFLIPGSDETRHFFERPHHGAYWTSTFRVPVELKPAGTDVPDIAIEQPDEWGDELLTFYHQAIRQFPFALRCGTDDLFAAFSAAELQDGMVLVARRRRRIVGLCVTAMEQERCYIREIVVADPRVQEAFVAYLCRRLGVDCIYDRAATTGALKKSQPYAMARVTNVVKFLKTVMLTHPGLEMHIGVDGDLDVPENNGNYLLRQGHLLITEDRPETIITPGGLAAMFLGAQPTVVRNMLDE